jgi:hypothetical protein
MKKDKTKELATTGAPSAALANVPAFLKGEAVQGLDNIDRADLILPRIKLMQDMSPEVQEGKAKAGELVNSLTGQNYGTRLEFVPLTNSKTRMFWQDRKEGNAVLCSSDDGKHPKDPTAAAKIAKKMKLKEFPVTMPDCKSCPFGNWAEDDAGGDREAPRCTSYYNFPMLIKGDSSPSALTMSRTKLKVGRKLLSLVVLSGDNVSIYAKRYELSTVKEKSDLGTYYNYAIKPIGYVTEAEYKVTKGLHESFKAMHVVVEQEHPEKND